MMTIGPVIGSAIEQFVAKVTVPILIDHPQNGLQLYATGTFFEVGGRNFLITARHLLDSVALTDLAVPLGPPGPDVRTLGSAEVIRPTDPDLDVMAVELQDNDFVNILRNAWNFLNISNVSSPTQHGAFILCGFPASATEKKGDGLGGRLLSFYTDRLDSPPLLSSFQRRPYDPSIDLFFRYAESGTMVRDGAESNTPALPGASGASVWEWLEPTTSVWTPEAALKVVAIQSSWDPVNKAWFRATSWKVVFNMLRAAGITVG